MRSAPSANSATFLGILSILFWSTTFAVSGNLRTEVGSVTSAGLAFLVGGALGLLPEILSSSRRRDLFELRPAYLLTCGGLIVAYGACVYLAIGLAADSRQVLEVSVLNYLWPTFTLLFSIPIIKTRPRPTLALGLCAACAGVLLALGKGRSFEWEPLRRNLETNWAPYLLAVGAAATWALYSVFARRLAAGSKGSAMPLFMLANGLSLLCISAGLNEPRHWSARAAGEVAFMALFPALLAFLCWDFAMRHGRVVLVVTLSYFTPILSLFVSSFYLKTPAGPTLWLGCLLVTAGAIICNYSLKEPAATAG